MKITDTNIPDVKIIEPTVLDDERGFFFERFNHKRFEEAIVLNDEALGITWPEQIKVSVSDKDTTAVKSEDMEIFYEHHHKN